MTENKTSGIVKELKFEEKVLKSPLSKGAKEEMVFDAASRSFQHFHE